VVLKAVVVSANQAQGGAGSQGNPDGRGLAGGVCVDPSASATMDMQTLIAGNQASTSDNDVWGNISMMPSSTRSVTMPARSGRVHAVPPQKVVNPDRLHTVTTSP
jgi:hypothetical protein